MAFSGNFIRGLVQRDIREAIGAKNLVRRPRANRYFHRLRYVHCFTKVLVAMSHAAQLTTSEGGCIEMPVTARNEVRHLGSMLTKLCYIYNSRSNGRNSIFSSIHDGVA
jgi:hypothetical protein